MDSGAPSPPPIDHFWLIPGRLAGGGHPARIGPDKDVLGALGRLGFNAILTLTHDALDADALERHGFRYLHLPIENMEAPSIAQAERAVEFLRRCAGDGLQVYVHCYAGYGRTGAILAAYLVASGTGPFAAIERVRSVRPGAIESVAQERFVLEYSRHLGEHE